METMYISVLENLIHFLLVAGYHCYSFSLLFLLPHPLKKRTLLDIRALRSKRPSQTSEDAAREGRRGSEGRAPRGRSGSPASHKRISTVFGE